MEHLVPDYKYPVSLWAWKRYIFVTRWISWLMFCKLKIDNKILTHQFGSAFKNSCRASFNYFLPNFNLWIVSWTIDKQYYLLMNKMHLIILLMQITPTLHFFVEANSFFIIFLKRILNICCSYLYTYVDRVCIWSEFNTNVYE